MPTTADRASEELAEAALADPGGAALIADTAKGFRARSWPTDYKDALGQPRAWTPGQLLQWALLNNAVIDRGVARVRIQVGAGPAADRCRDLNAAMLADLPVPFDAAVDHDQQQADRDGSLRWTQPIRATAMLDGADEGVHLPPGAAPLEIGSCNPATVRLHLLRYGAVARWPYDSEDLWLFVGLPTPGEWSCANNPARTRLAALVRQSLAPDTPVSEYLTALRGGVTNIERTRRAGR